MRRCTDKVGKAPPGWAFGGVSSLLQQQVNHTREAMRAVDYVGVDAGVEAIGVLKVALADDVVGIGSHLLHVFPGREPTEHVH